VGTNLPMAHMGLNFPGPDNFQNLKKLVEQFQRQQPAGAHPKQEEEEEEDDEVPELVAGETFETAAEDGHTS
jgi:nascent polypeptide-associated complex subunit beta